MATIRLIPSEWYNGASQYVTITNPENAYHNVDNTTYTTLTNTTSSTSSRYVYLRGFNFDDIPSDATINSFTVKVHGHETGVSTSTSYAPSLANGTSSISSTTASENFGETEKTITVPTGALTWNNIKTYGSDFSIRLNVRRNSRNTTGYLYINGAEIDVNYTPASPPRTVTTTLSGNGTIVPSGQTSIYEGDEFELTITPTNKSDTVTATKNSIDISNDLVPHYEIGPSTSDDRVLGSYTLVSGSFNGSGGTYFSGRNGKGHTASQTTSNYYSSSSGTIAVFTYDISFTIPSNALVTNLYVMVNGHAESTSNANEYMCAQIISGSTELSEELNFKSIGTSNSTQTITADTMPTPAQVASLKLQCRLGYYGVAINGAPCYIEYAEPTTTIDYYTYSYIVTGDATIAVTIGASQQPKLYVKESGSWKEVLKAYKKINGSWVEQTDLTTVFQSGINYKRE